MAERSDWVVARRPVDIALPLAASAPRVRLVSARCQCEAQARAEFRLAMARSVGALRALRA